MESKYWKLLMTSLAVAITSVFGPVILDRSEFIGFALIGPELSIAWCLIVVYAFQHYKRRTL
jgi:hypothetical protein